MEKIEEMKMAAMNEIKKVIVGQDEIVEQVLIGLFAGGHILLEGVPGIAKTLLVRLVAKIFSGSFKRIQFTPDLMPSDVTGVSIYNPQEQCFVFRPGPIFANFLLADEINRAPAKTQSALLEAMQENQVTVDGTTHPLPALFITFATQNPIEHEGTYPLPEAQLDRFMMKILIGYPEPAQEIEIYKLHHQGLEYTDLSRLELATLADVKTILDCRQMVRSMVIRDEVVDYAAKIVQATRQEVNTEFGASPRAGLMLILAAKTHAAFEGRNYVLPDDVKVMTKPVLRHRLVLKPASQIEGVTPDNVLDIILSRIEVPR